MLITKYIINNIVNPINPVVLIKYDTMKSVAASGMYIVPLF